MIKKGGWFLAVHRFKCEGCKREVPITYSDKVALFNKHAAPLTTSTDGEPRPTAPSSAKFRAAR
jgi:hypothetical protein